MTKEALLARLKELAEDPDFFPRDDHIEADKLPLEYIDDPLVTAYFDQIEKWYA